MPREAEVVLWITPQPGLHHPPTGNGAEPELEHEVSTPDELEENLRRLIERGSPPTVTVIDERVERPVRIARRVYGVAPLTQILFLVPAEQLASFRRELALAPMIGTNWSIVEGAATSLHAELLRALKTGKQRRQLRTNIDAINVRLANPRPAPDSSEYRKLVISDSYLATILEFAQDAIISLDLHGRVASWNQGAATLFGYPPTAALGLQVGDLAVVASSEKLREWFVAAQQGSPVRQGEIECRKAGGKSFTAEVTLAPVRDESGEVIAVSVIARDVTRRIETEEELRSIQAELEQRVVKRTEALRYLNAELEAFTYSASHDLRAPLRGIDGFSQALLEDYGGLLEPAGTRYLERIRSAAQRMGEIIDALLMLSRISTATLKLGRVDIARLSREIMRELQEAEPGRRLEFEVQPDLVVRADPQLMRIALQNLLGNAWKFTRERDTAVIVVGRESAGNEDTFFVRDNGAGFDMAYAEKLFAPFQRIHQPNRFEGSGIGLGTVQRVINRHGGKVWGIGRPDEGATFYFQLPDETSDRKPAESSRTH